MATPPVSDTAAALLASMACDFWECELYASEDVLGPVMGACCEIASDGGIVGGISSTGGAAMRHEEVIGTGEGMATG